MEVSSWENHLFVWTMASIAMLVITRGYSNFASLTWIDHHPYIELIDLYIP